MPLCVFAYVLTGVTVKHLLNVATAHVFLWIPQL